MTVMCAHNPMGYGEAETRAMGASMVCTLMAADELRQFLFAEAGALVAHPDDRSGPGYDRHGSAHGRRADGIFNEVSNPCADRFPVAVYHWHLASDSIAISRPCAMTVAARDETLSSAKVSRSSGSGVMGMVASASICASSRS